MANQPEYHSPRCDAKKLQLRGGFNGINIESLEDPFTAGEAE